MAKARTAQVWAVEIMESIERTLLAGRELPFDLPASEGLTRGKAIRTVQEVNLAKKRKRELLQARALSESLAGRAFKLPQELFWKLGYRVEGGKITFYADFPSGRTTRTSEFTAQLTKDIVDGLGASTPAGLPAPEPQPLIKPSMDSVIDRYIFGDKRS